MTENVSAGTSILDRIRRPREERQINFEEVLDINNDLKIYRNNEINLLNPRRLYQVGRIKSFLGENVGLFRANRE